MRETNLGTLSTLPEEIITEILEKVLHKTDFEQLRPLTLVSKDLYRLTYDLKPLLSYLTSHIDMQEYSDADVAAKMQYYFGLLCLILNNQVAVNFNLVFALILKIKGQENDFYSLCGSETNLMNIDLNDSDYIDNKDGLVLALEKIFKTYPKDDLRKICDALKLDCYARELLEIACNNDCPAMAEYASGLGAKLYISENNIESELRDSIEECKITKIKYILSDNNQLDINKFCPNGNSYLKYAIDSKKSEVIDLLVKNGARLDIPVDTCGMSPIIYVTLASVFYNEQTMFDVLNCLIDLGSPINHLSYCKDLHINSYYYTGVFSPLHVAVLNSHESLVKFFLEKGANLFSLAKITKMSFCQRDDIIEKNYNILHLNAYSRYVAYQNRHKVLKLLLESGAGELVTQTVFNPGQKITDSYWHVIIQKTALEQLLLLLPYVVIEQAEIDGKIICINANSFKSEVSDVLKFKNFVADIFAKWKESFNNNTKNYKISLISLVSKFPPDICQLLISVGMEPETIINDDYGLCHFACLNGNLALLDWLSLNLKCDLKKIITKNNENLLHYTLSHVDNLSVLEYLLRQNLDFYQEDSNGRTAMHILVDQPNTKETIEFTKEAVKLLIDFGFDVNYKNHRGETALFSAYKMPMLKILLLNGAQINIRDENGRNIIEHYIFREREKRTHYRDDSIAILKILLKLEERLQTRNVNLSLNEVFAYIEAEQPPTIRVFDYISKSELAEFVSTRRVLRPEVVSEVLNDHEPKPSMRLT